MRPFDGLDTFSNVTVIDIPLLDVAASFMAERLVQDSSGEEVPTIGDAIEDMPSPPFAPVGMYADANGNAFYIESLTQGQFEGLCEAVGREDLLEDERFATMDERVDL